jgi:hypothetical protein
MELRGTGVDASRGVGGRYKGAAAPTRGWWLLPWAAAVAVAMAATNGNIATSASAVAAKKNCLYDSFIPFFFVCSKFFEGF